MFCAHQKSTMIKGLVPMVVLLGDGFLFKNNSHLG
jgi:hypothetical protein